MADMPSRVQPQGFAATILGITILLSLLCITAVMLRMWVRVHDRIFHVEDGFMLAGLVVNLMQYGVVIWGTTVGIGSSDESILVNPLLMEALLQVEYYLNMTYITAMGLVKVSVCGTLIRINQGHFRRTITWALWFVMLVIVTSTLGGLITFIVRCTSNNGCQDSDRTMAIFNWVGVAFYMACDLALAVIPIFILKDLKMKRSLKVSIGAILGLGGLACLAAILRIPAQLGVFGSGSNAMYNLGNFILWSEIELGLGIICGCAPAIHKLLKGWLKEPSKSSPTMQGKPYAYPPVPPKDTPRVGMVAYKPSNEKLRGLSPQISRSIAYPTKTFATTMTDSTMSTRSLDNSMAGSSRGLVEYRVPMDIEQAGLWGPSV